MNKEIEAKFLKVDHDALRAQLTALGAHCEHPMRLMRRVIFHPKVDPENTYFRVRDEGGFWRARHPNIFGPREP